MNDRIEWTCDECGRAIENGEGYVTVNGAEVKEAQRQTAEWKSKHRTSTIDVADYADLTSTVKWQAIHNACDPRSELGDFIIDVDRLRTARHALGWTLELHRMGWVRATNWDSYIKVRAGATMSRSLA